VDAVAEEALPFDDVGFRLPDGTVADADADPPLDLVVLAAPVPAVASDSDSESEMFLPKTCLLFLIRALDDLVNFLAAIKIQPRQKYLDLVNVIVFYFQVFLTWLFGHWFILRFAVGRLRFGRNRSRLHSCTRTFHLRLSLLIARFLLRI